MGGSGREQRGRGPPSAAVLGRPPLVGVVAPLRARVQALAPAAHSRAGPGPHRPLRLNWGRLGVTTGQGVWTSSLYPTDRPTSPTGSPHLHPPLTRAGPLPVSTHPSPSLLPTPSSLTTPDTHGFPSSGHPAPPGTSALSEASSGDGRPRSSPGEGTHFKGP